MLRMHKFISKDSKSTTVKRWLVLIMGRKIAGGTGGLRDDCTSKGKELIRDKARDAQQSEKEMEKLADDDCPNATLGIPISCC